MSKVKSSRFITEVDNSTFASSKQKILQWIKDEIYQSRNDIAEDEITTLDIQMELNCSRRHAQQVLELLAQKGKLTYRVGYGGKKIYKPAITKK